MKVHLQYGRDGIDVEIPSSRVRVIEPIFVPGLPDEAGAFAAAVRDPIGGKPLRECVAAHERVAIVIPDITRPLPTDRLLLWCQTTTDAGCVGSGSGFRGPSNSRSPSASPYWMSLLALIPFCLR